MGTKISALSTATAAETASGFVPIITGTSGNFTTKRTAVSNIGGGGGASVTISSTAPTATNGALWFNEDSGELYIYSSDLNGWIQTNGGGGSGGGEVYDSGWIACSPSYTTNSGTGKVMDFTHSLGEQPQNITVLLSGSATGTNAWQPDLILDANNNNMYGYSVAEIGSSTMRIWMSTYGVLEYKGAAMSGDASSNGATTHQWGSGNAAYVRVIATIGAGGAGSSGDGHIWKFVSEGSAPLLIDNRVLFAPQHHGSTNHSRLYVSDLNGVVTQTIFSGPKWPTTSGSSGNTAALRTSLLADWETATSTNVDVYISYPSAYVLKIPFNRSTQTFGTPSGYGTGGGFFNVGWKIAACYDGGTSKHFISSLTYADSTHSIIGGPNRLEQSVYASTGTNGYYNLSGVTHYLGDFRPLIKSPDGKQLCEGSGGTGAEALYGNLIGINHVTGRVYYRGLTNGFLYIFQINPSASGSTYAEKFWNMSAISVPNPVNSNLTYVKTALLPIEGDVTIVTDTTVNFDKEGNETAISYGSYHVDTQRHNVNMGIIAWNPAWN